VGTNRVLGTVTVNCYVSSNTKEGTVGEHLSSSSNTSLSNCFLAFENDNPDTLDNAQVWWSVVPMDKAVRRNEHDQPATAGSRQNLSLVCLETNKSNSNEEQDDAVSRGFQ